MLRNNNLKTLVLVILFSLAAFLRIWQLNTNPPSLNWDEVSHGYNAYSILKTGRDEWGAAFPLTSFRAYGDYKLPVYIYTIVTFITIFGLNEWSVRLPSAIAGVGTVILVFFLIKIIFQSFSLAFLSAFFLAISPWHLVISRAGFEANLALFLVVLGLLLLTINPVKMLPFSFLIFGLSTYTYNSAKIFVPLLVIAVLWMLRENFIKKSKSLVLGCLILMVLFLPHLVLLGSDEGKARFYWTTILDQGAINVINESRVNSSLPPFLSRLVYNRPVYFVNESIENWASHFSLRYLFFEGGTHFQYSIPGFGVAYVTTLPFLLLGVFFSIISKNKMLLVVLIWFMISPIPAAITRDSPHALRSVFEIVPLQVLTALGVKEVGQKFRKFFRVVFYALTLILLVISLLSFTKTYLRDYRREYSWVWQYGYKQLSEFVATNYYSYSKLIITKKYGEPHEFLLFYLKWPPHEFQSDRNLIRFYKSNWYWVDRFDKFYFINDWQVPKNKHDDFFLESGGRIEIDGKVLLITSPGNAPAGWRKIGDIPFLDNKIAFELYEN